MNSAKSIIRRFVTFLFAVVLFFGVATAPSFAADQKASPTPNIMKATEELVDTKPMNMEEIQERTAGGLNEVQGTADYKKMKNDSRMGEPDNIVASKMEKTAKKLSR